jgi:hypothetical protein
MCDKKEQRKKSCRFDVELKGETHRFVVGKAPGGKIIRVCTKCGLIEQALAGGDE